MNEAQFEKNIRISRQSIQLSYDALPDHIGHRRAERICFNLWMIVKDFIDISLHEWRRGNAPLVDMNAGLVAADTLVAAIDEYGAQHDDYADVDFRLIESCAYLANRGFRWRLPMAAIDRNADVALSDLLNRALRDEPYEEGLDALFDKLASNKRRALAVASYRTYFALLDGKAAAECRDELVKQADANYHRRARDSYYSSGPEYRGGGPDNPYAVDIELACVLKKIGWEGDSIHRWLWG